MPVFALSNAGLTLAGFGEMLWNPVAVGIMLGLLLGKPVGIVLFRWFAVRMNLAALPEKLAWGDLIGVAWLGGIGFTMALFIATLAFEGSPLLASGKAGVIVGSSVAGIVGYVTIRGQLRRVAAGRG